MDYEKYGKVYRKGNIVLVNCDCMDLMKDAPDNYWQLACVDPPYGIGMDGEIEEMANNNSKKWKSAQGTGYERKYWDNMPPTEKYFEEVMRVSKNQIIWGGNYFELPQSSGWIFWDKGVAKDFTLSPGELAWTSYQKSVKKVYLLWAGFRKCEEGKRTHPTQKPVKLYDWLLTNYAEPGQRIIDTHGGSMSSAIAGHYFGCDMVVCEIDKDYYDAGVNRFEHETAQLALL